MELVVEAKQVVTTSDEPLTPEMLFLALFAVLTLQSCGAYVSTNVVRQAIGLIYITPNLYIQ